MSKLPEQWAPWLTDPDPDPKPMTEKEIELAAKKTVEMMVRKGLVPSQDPRPSTPSATKKK